MDHAERRVTIVSHDGWHRHTFDSMRLRRVVFEEPEHELLLQYEFAPGFAGPSDSGASVLLGNVLVGIVVGGEFDESDAAASSTRTYVTPIEHVAAACGQGATFRVA